MGYDYVLPWSAEEEENDKVNTTGHANSTANVHPPMTWVGENETVP